LLMVAKGSNCPMWRPSATLFIMTEQLYSTPPNCSHQRPVLLPCTPVWLTSTAGGVMNVREKFHSRQATKEALVKFAPLPNQMSSITPRVISDCHFSVQLNHFIPSYSYHTQ
jgi:hypothetical protein